MDDFWSGLQETLLAGVDGYYSVQRAKVEARAAQPVETLAPIPGPDRTPTYTGGVLANLPGEYIWFGAAALLGVLLLTRK